MRVIFPIEKIAGSGKIIYPDDRSTFSNVVIDGSNIIADYSGQLPLDAFIESSLPITDITVTGTRFKVGDAISFTFTTELPDDSYFIPYRVDGDGRKYLKDAVVANGTGSIVFTFDRGGIYYIDRADLLLTDLHINGSTAERFTIYVAE
ncbi:MAG: hypothetical protein PVF17_00255 [Ignavibacteria bacterium]|jgi:hypothetical protein